MTVVMMRQMSLGALDERSVGRAGFNVPPNTLYVISGTIFTGMRRVRKRMNRMTV